MNQEKIKQAIEILQSLLEDGFKLEGTFTHWTDMGEGKFKDNKTGTIWGPIQDGIFSHYQAAERFGDGLPTEKEFEEAEKNGIRQVLNLKNGYFWSASFYPYIDSYVLAFDGRYGTIGSIDRGYDYGSVILVER